jgi:hypothetical protein
LVEPNIISREGAEAQKFIPFFLSGFATLVEPNIISREDAEAQNLFHSSLAALRLYVN